MARLHLPQVQAWDVPWVPGQNVPRDPWGKLRGAQPVSPMLHLDWPDCLNVRDLGGYLSADGTQTRLRAFIRSDSLHRLTAEGRAALIGYGVRTTIDLRFAAEAAREPNPFADRTVYTPVSYLNLPLMYEPHSEAEAAFRAARNVKENYCLMLDYYGPMIARVMITSAEAPAGGVLIHCNAGKDRTGLVVALLLALVGIPHSAIVEEYALSDVYLQPLYQKMLEQETDAKVRERRSQKLARFIQQAPAVMRAVLAYLDAHYQGPAAYLCRNGVTEEQLQTLRQRFLEDIPCQESTLS